MHLCERLVQFKRVTGTIGQVKALLVPSYLTKQFPEIVIKL